MIPTRTPLTRLLAALMPALLLWAFVGCVAVCAAHAEEGRGGGVEAASVELRDSHCSEPCPITEASFLVPAKRFALDQQAVAAQPAPAPPAQEPPRTLSFSGRHPETLRPPGPPFERLRTLRI